MALAEHGFAVEPFGERAYRLRSVPAVLAAQADAEQGFLAFVDDLDRGDAPGESRDRVAMSLWYDRWRADGVFCVVWSERDAHCEADGVVGGLRSRARPAH